MSDRSERSPDWFFGKVYDAISNDYPKKEERKQPTYPPVTLYVVIDKRTGELAGKVRWTEEEAYDSALWRAFHRDKKEYVSIARQRREGWSTYEIRRVAYVAKEGQ